MTSTVRSIGYVDTPSFLEFSATSLFAHLDSTVRPTLHRRGHEEISLRILIGLNPTIHDAAEDDQTGARRVHE